MLNKVANVLGSIGASCLLLLALPAQAQPNAIHQLGVLGGNDTQLNSGRYFDTYEIAGSAGQRVSISLDSSDFDTYLGLLDSDGNIVSTNDDAAADNPNSYFSATLPRNDTYTVVVTSYEQQSGGDYRMVVRNFSPPPVANTSARTTARSSSGSGLRLLGQLLSIPAVREGVVNAFFNSMSSGSSPSYQDDYRLIRGGSAYPSAPQSAPRPVPPIGGNRGLYGSDHSF